MFNSFLIFTFVLFFFFLFFPFNQTYEFFRFSFIFFTPDSAQDKNVKFSFRGDSTGRCLFLILNSEKVHGIPGLVDVMWP